MKEYYYNQYLKAKTKESKDYYYQMYLKVKSKEEPKDLTPRDIKIKDLLSQGAFDSIKAIQKAKTFLVS
jgi:hypothetical protein